MNKKILLSVFVVLALSLSFSSVAMASASFNKNTPYTVYAEHGVDKYQSFKLNETPYAYALIKNSDDESPTLMTWEWFYEDELTSRLTNTQSLTIGSKEHKFWNADSEIEINDWKAAWGSEVETGSWSVTTTWVNDGKTGFKDASFTVTPEPISTVLFLVGGLPLGASLLRRKKS